VQFTVGLKLKGKTDHIAVDAEDALIAALKVKTVYPEAVITYVRQQNRRGDARHPLVTGGGMEKRPPALPASTGQQSSSGAVPHCSGQLSPFACLR
jgi:hypothetical protein